MTDRATDRWIATAPAELPPLAGAEDAAQRILLLLHFSIDWEESWVSRKRVQYWDKTLPDYVISAAIREGTLHRFWSAVAADLVATPRGPREREELAILLSHPDPEGVLDTLRESTIALILRVRLIADAWRSHQKTRKKPTTDSGDVQ